MSYVSEMESVPRPEALAKAESFGLNEFDVDKMEEKEYLETQHDDAGAPYFVVAEEGHAVLEKKQQDEKTQKAARAATFRSWIALLISLIALFKGWLFLR